MHKSERLLPSNTANLSMLSLENTSIFERGHKDDFLCESFLDTTNYTPLYLFPSNDSAVLSASLLKTFDKPINLIVPDGNWRQAKKYHLREELLKIIPRVRIETSEPSIYELRRQTKEYGLCTHEAIAHALGTIESEDIKKKLLTDLEIMNRAHILSKPVSSLSLGLKEKYYSLDNSKVELL